MAVETDPVHELQSAASSQMTDDSPRIGLPEGCPTPLGWAQVLDSFRSESTSWTLQHDGAVIEGRTLGRGRPVYFLNAIAGDSELFCLLAWLLRDDFRCVVFDYPTRDETSLRQRRQTAMALAADLLAIADSQGDEVFSLFATPFGSLVALAALYSNPDRVDRAVFLGGFAHRRLSLAERLLIRAGRHLHGTLAGIPLRERIERANHDREFPPFDAGRQAFYLDNVGRTPIRDLADRAAIVESTDFRRRLEEIRRPVLLIRTEHEGQISDECQTVLEQGLPQVAVERLASTGPLAYLTHPHRLAKSLRAFLAGPESHAGSFNSSCAAETPCPVNPSCDESYSTLKT